MYGYKLYRTRTGFGMTRPSRWAGKACKRWRRLEEEEEEEEDMLQLSADEPGLRVEPVGVRRKADVASG